MNVYVPGDVGLAFGMIQNPTIRFHDSGEFVDDPFRVLFVYKYEDIIQVCPRDDFDPMFCAGVSFQFL